MSTQQIKIALAGNPNSGKSSLFNALTGMNQKVGNFPGVTVDKKTGTAPVSTSLKARITDLPGTYSLYPKSLDEFVAYEVLLNPKSKEKPDLIIVVADASNLKRSLLFFSQILDLGKPVILALTMMDIARKKETDIDIEGLERELGVAVIPVNPRKNKGLGALKKEIERCVMHSFTPQKRFVDIQEETLNTLKSVKEICGIESDYGALHIACASDKMNFLEEAQKTSIQKVLAENHFQKAAIQGTEVMQRYQKIGQILQKTVVEVNPLKKKLVSDRLDKILLHKVWGNIILLLVLFVMFQCIFWVASYPMDWIDAGFTALQNWVSGILPKVWWSDLLVNGLLAGIGGIIVFIPQIAILFGFINILEDTGYMARISFLTDRLMRSTGLNGRSVMPLISGMACAIPAIMAARTIENPKERLITILVTPLMSCSARLPIYTILIALVVPQEYYFGFINAQGLVMMGMYLLGFVMALVVSKVMSWIMSNKENGMFLMELPVYRAPRWKNVGTTMYQKAKVFVWDAGKVILIISLVLWGMASYGPPSKMAPIKAKYEALQQRQGNVLTEAQQNTYATEKLDNSFAGIVGKVIEPVIRPLGYDWKMGIALITSFAAREVFVGTMATIYSVGKQDADITLQQKMRNARRPDGSPVYTVATGFSLMIFYALAMQCMSTLAVVKRETKTWKWPMLQLGYMTGMAYIFALITFQLLK